MRAKDLSIGMEVALKANSYDKNAVPQKNYVVSLDYTTVFGGWAYSSRTERVAISLPTSITGGEEVVVMAPIREYRAAERRDHVVVARHDGESWRVSAQPLRTVEGPYEEVKTRRAEARKRYEAARDESLATSRENRRRRAEVVTSLRPLLGENFESVGYREDQIALTLDQAEKLIEAMTSKEVAS